MKAAPTMTSLQVRPFSQRMENGKDGVKEKNQYQAEFDNLLGNNKGISKEERDFINRQDEAKKIADAQALKE